MNGFPTGYSTRPATLDDAGRIAELINGYLEAITGRAVVSAEALRQQMQMPEIDCRQDTRLVIAPNGGFAAFAAAFHVAPHVHVNGLAPVAIPHQGIGIGSKLLAWIEDRAAQALKMAPPDARVSLAQTVDEDEKAAIRLLEENGYQQVRHFWRMLIELDDAGSSDEIVWPDGVFVSTMQLPQDLLPALRAGRDAFRDHWGHVEGPEDEALERMRYRAENDPDFDPTLRFLAREGSEIVGICNVRAKDGTDETTGYIETLGVRRSWRRKGIAKALLLHAFDACRNRGLSKVALHVDAASLTGATRLYESAGMHISELSHAYEKELRPGVELSTQELANADEPA